jgi:hypothetical protein
MGLRRIQTFLLVALSVLPSIGFAQQTRRLAPGVKTTIPPQPLAEETFTGPIKIVGLSAAGLKWSPNYSTTASTLFERGNRSILRRDVWNLEFSFKPLRMVEVDLPQGDGKLERKVVWYMVYQIRYLGKDIRPSRREDEFGNVTYPTVEPAPVSDKRFHPTFVMEALEYNKSYMDRILPAAKRVIAARERVGRPLYDSVEISQQALKQWTPEDDTSVWGVVTWADVDPRIDFFSIYIRGLTNAYQITESELGPKPTLKRKTLRLNFWRPGDAIRQLEDEIRYGVPIETDEESQLKILKQYGLEERLDHMWIYR